MIDPERIQPRGPLFTEPSPAERLTTRTPEISACHRVTSGGSAFLPRAQRWKPLPLPAPDKLIVGRPDHKRMVMELQKKFSNQLGFLPGKAIDFYLDEQLVGIALENAEPCGYVLGRPSMKYQPLIRPITQAAVFMDAQRRHHGLALVAAVCRRAVDARQLVVQARVAIDIEAVEFWTAAGFEDVHVEDPGNARARKIVTFRRCVTPAVPAWFFDPPQVSRTRRRPAKSEAPAPPGGE